MQAHWQTVTFTRVFDFLDITSGKKAPGTVFSFEMASGRQFGIYVPDKPRIQEGDTITALLRKPDDWQTLAGWINHETGEIVGPGRARVLMHLITVLAGSGLASLPLRDQWPMSLLALPFVLFTVVAMYYFVSSFIIHRRLHHKARDIANG